VAHTGKDDLHAIVDDMVSLGLAPEESKSGLITFFDKVAEKGIEFAKQRRRSMYEKGQIAGVEGIDFDVDLRLITEESFNPLNVKIEDYKPTGAELIPVALVNIELNDGIKKEIARFQVNFSELEDIIVKLQACQKELRLLQTVAQNINLTSIE
jgi:hypothetical protein